MIAGRRARVIAFYLPQFHPIPENDAWWGPGFTEWTNVAKARPLFPGHYQPHVPADLGFYDLRLPETRRAQAALALEHGVEAFCYWHYWFAGRRILERPFREVLESGEPDFPFCLGWANQSWTGVWHGATDRVLLEQTYPGDDDHRRHFEAVLPAFHDPRYLRVHGRPVFYLYDPTAMPDVGAFVDLWRTLADRSGLPGLYLVAESPPGWDAVSAGFDAAVVLPWLALTSDRPRTWKAAGRVLRLPKVVPYERVTRALVRAAVGDHRLPVVIPNWDNTPRSTRRGIVLQGATPEAFEHQVRSTAAVLDGRDPEERLLFVKSWNEWAEGNHLEPDRRFGRGHLEALRRAVVGSVGFSSTPHDERLAQQG